MVFMFYFLLSLFYNNEVPGFIINHKMNYQKLLHILHDRVKYMNKQKSRL